MTDIFDEDDAATPLTDDEKKGLIPTHIALRRELNEAEQRGVLDGEQWAFGRRHKNILNQAFLRELHFQMFKDVWRGLVIIAKRNAISVSTPVKSKSN